MAHHAADGALPIALAALDSTAAAFYSPGGGKARSLADAAMRLEPAQIRRGDPAGFDDATVEAFWERLVEATPGLADAWGRGVKEEL